jgi:sporulation protein YlmC with PRC-barrel domain
VTQQQPDDLLADRVIGMNVRNPQNDKIGTIHDLVMDKGGQVKAAVLSVGGFLGIGDKKVAVPWDQVQIHMEDRDRYASVNMNKEQLTQAPEFKTAEDQRRDAERATSRERATTPGAGSGAPADRPAGGTGSPAR